MPRYIYKVPPPPESLGDVLRREREKRGLSQWEVVDYINDRLGTNLRQGSMSAWERGATQVPDPAALAVLDDLFGFPRGHLLDLAEAGRGANRRRALQAPPEPGSIIIPPSDTKGHRIAAWIQEQDDVTLDKLIVIISHADEGTIDAVIRAIRSQAARKAMTRITSLSDARLDAIGRIDQQTFDAFTTQIEQQFRRDIERLEQAAADEIEDVG